MPIVNTTSLKYYNIILDFRWYYFLAEYSTTQFPRTLIHSLTKLKAV